MSGRDFRGPGGSWAGGPSQHQKSSAASLQEKDALISAYEHLTTVPEPHEALLRLRKIASLVKPIMRKRGWHVRTLAEFLPESPQLLGLNINRGQKICVRLRYSHNPKSFLPIEECVDTMLHELSHIVHGPHDAKFHALWDELRDEHETLLMRGYTGEGFLTRGHRLGGSMPPQELRRLARQNAENSRRQQDDPRRSGVRLGGKRIMPGQDARTAIADAIERRNTINRGCASGSHEAESLSRQAAANTARTQSGEDDANDRAIAEALLELMEEEELQRLNEAGGLPEPGLAWDPKRGLYSVGQHSDSSTSLPNGMTEDEQMEWAIQESIKALPSLHQMAPSSKPPIPDYISKPLPQLPFGPPVPDHASKPSFNSGSSNLMKSDATGPPPKKRSRAGTPVDAIVTRDGPSQSRYDGAGPTRSQDSLQRLKPSTDLRSPSCLGPTSPTSPTPTALAQALSAASHPFSPPAAFPPPVASAIPRPPTSRTATASPAPAPAPSPAPPQQPSEAEEWACDICTLSNPPRYLACGACGMERPPIAHKLTRSSAAENMARVERQAAVSEALRPRQDSLGWACQRCGTFVEHKYWTCTMCGLMKASSRA